MMTAMWSTKVDHAADVHVFLLLDKPLGLSSAGAVARQAAFQAARRAIRDRSITGFRFAAHLFWRSHEVRRAAPGCGQNLLRDGSSG